MDKKFAIFDMDGTLIDSMIFWENLALEYLKCKGIKHIPKGIIERIKPMTMSESAALFQREFGLTGNPEDEMNAMMDEHYKNDIPLKPGVKQHLQMLKNRDVRMCVASTTAAHLMEDCLARLDIRKYFEFLLSCETVGAAKNTPLVYHESAKRFNALPEEIAVYEDALYAVKTAKGAGYYVVAIYDKSSAENWKAIEKIADKTILNWEETI